MSRTKFEDRVEKSLTKFIDFFYFPFLRFVPRDLFRYGACGGLNFVLDVALYYVLYHFVFKAQVFDLGFIAFTPHIAAFLLKFPITFLTGFWMARHISFSGSNLRGRTQIVRYLMVTLVNFVLNYVLLKLFNEVFHWWPTVSYVAMYIICIAFSYLTNKYFSFRKGRTTEPEE